MRRVNVKNTKDLLIMEKVLYKKSFTDALAFCNKNEKHLYLGTGNPNGKIVFIGKEAAINIENFQEQHRRELTKNLNDWDNNSIKKLQFSSVDDWFKKDGVPFYNPLYPYKGQINKVESRNKDGEIIRGIGGTSKTWYNYQKIIDVVNSNEVANDLINFHEYAFCSELNQVTGAYSNTIPKNIRKASIEKRKDLFRESFFREFPITIVAVGHYVRDFDIDVEDIFDMKFDKKLSNEFSEGLDKEYINIHFDNLENPSKLLIHTNQLSMVSNELIKRIGEVCKSFLLEKVAVKQ